MYEKGDFHYFSNFTAQRNFRRATKTRKPAHGPLFRTGGAWCPLPVCEYSYVVTCVACRSLSSVYDFQRFTEETCFFASFFIETEGQSGGETRRVPRGPPRPPARGKATARRPTTRFRRRSRTHSGLSNRNCTTGARSLVSCAVRRPSAKHSEEKKRGFSIVAFPLLLGRRARDATIALV